jgi:hydrogenase nickel incorporation protein HypA/HybF
MHELSLAVSVVQIVCDEASRHGLGRIECYRLEVGALRAVVPELLTTCLGYASKGTMAEGSAIEIREVAGQAHCVGCDHTFAVQEVYFVCPQCGRAGGTILAGEELRVIDLEGE